MSVGEPRRVEVFFYGLFMDEELLRSKGVAPARVEPASVRGFRLRIGRRATLEPAPDGIAYGVLASLTHSEVDALYADPSVREYRPEAVLAELADGGSRAALCYNLPALSADEPRDPDYAARLKSLARTLGFPEEYAAAL